MNTSLKKELVDEIVSRSGGRLSSNSPELEQEITRQLADPTSLLHLVDYSSRDDYHQINSTDLRRVSRIDVTTSLRLVQRYRTIIHRLCQLHRSHLRLTHHAEQQRHLILISRDEYYLLDLTSHTTGCVSANISDIRQRQHDIFKREVNNVIHQPFDYAKYRRDAEQQQRVFEQRYRQKQTEQKQHNQQIHKGPPPPGHPSEAEFYLG
jgi:PAS domain-containing protein